MRFQPALRARLQSNLHLLAHPSHVRKTFMGFSWFETWFVGCETCGRVFYRDNDNVRRYLNFLNEGLAALERK